MPGPPNLGYGRTGLRTGVERMEGKGLLGEKDQDRVLGSGCLVSPFPHCCLDVLCHLVLYIYFFLIEIRARAGNKGKTLEGAAPGVGAVMEPLPATGLAQSPTASF